jgi:uncharacterized protein with NRDE domain
MCTIILAVRHHPEYKLILASNRDEYYERPASPAAFWKETPDLLAGRDEKEWGTWLGITRQGRIGTLTNYRDPASLKENAPSRGRMVLDYLKGTETPSRFLERLIPEAGQYNGFNLILGDRDRLFWYSSRGGSPQALSPGIHGLSNHLLDTPWPKVLRAKEAMGRLLAEKQEPSPEALFHILSDRTKAPDQDLPRTGVPLEWERTLSSIFIVSPTYGTRASTLLFIDGDDRITFMEKTFGPEAKQLSSVKFGFRMAP